MGIGHQTSQQINNKIIKTTMARVLNLRDVLQLVVDGLNNKAFAQQAFIQQGHQLVLHVAPHTGDELNILLQQLPKKLL